MNVIVVGAGIAGSSITRLLRERGHTVTMIGQEESPHSQAATAVLRSAYHKDPHEQAAFQASMALYERWGIPLRRGALVTSYRNPAAAPRRDPDWALIDPAAPLLTPDFYDTISHVTARTVVGRAVAMEADAVVLAVGADSALSAPGTQTWGVTWAHADPSVLTSADLRIHHVAPYKSVMVGYIGGQARLGSSSAPSRDTAVKQGEAMLHKCHALGYITTTKGWTPLIGARLKTAPQAEWRPDGVYVLTGFHRTGYAIAPSLAYNLARRIDKGNDV
ncbi:FAD-dependent oxidoreductase [Microbispora sp. NPDC049125]|uniref:FAD-dependent oxidoreductase n=1 Tax=Microbispora sp. NPDC049125 TaxID=3154929 RepID=UPI0034654EE1